MSRAEDHLVQHLTQQAMSLFLEPRREPRVYAIEIGGFRDLLLANGLTTIDRLAEFRMTSSAAILEFERSGDPELKEKLFRELSLVEKCVVLVGKGV